MATPPNHRNPAGNPSPPGFMGQGFVQPNSIISANSSQHIQMQMQMQIQTQMLQIQQLMSTQAHGCNCHVPFALPNNVICGANGGNSQAHPNSANSHMSFPSNQMPHLNSIPVPGIGLSGPLQNPSPDQAPTNQGVVLGIPVPNAGFGSGQMPHFQTHMQPNSLQSPIPGHGANIPMLSSALGPGRPPHFHKHFHPNSMQMSNNNNMHVIGQQYTMSQQQLVAAASSMQNFSCIQSCHNGFPPGASFPLLQANNGQTVPPQGSNPSLSTHTNSSSSSMPPVPSYPPPMPMKNGPVANGSIPSMLTPYPQPNTVEPAQCQGQMPNLLISSHHMRPLIHSPPLPPGQRPPHLATTHFPSPLEQAAQTVTSVSSMGQNYVEMSQKAAAHSAGNPLVEVGGSIPLHKNEQQPQQDQQNMHPSKHQTLEGCSDEQDRNIKEPHITNDIQRYQTGICDRGYPSRIGGGRWNSQNGRTGSGQSSPKWNIESSRFNTSEQPGGRAKKGSPMAQFPPTRVFDNGSSRFSKKSAGCTRLYASALTCKSCDCSFTNRFQMEQHFKGHVKCEEKACSFEASGKILKEHKLTHHGKQSVQSVVPPKFEESIEEIQQWIDERKRNYPTEANVKRKVQQLQERRARGELMDDEAKKRRQRMREILARQRELGVLAEVPSHYINDGQYNHKGRCKKGSWQHHDDLGKPNLSANSASKVPRVRDLASPRSVLNHANSLNVEQPAEGKTAIAASEIPCSEGNLLFETPPEKVDEDCKTENSASHHAIKTMDTDVQHAEDNKYEKNQRICKYFQRGHCRKGRRCTYLHIRQSNKTHKKTTVTSDPPKREPTLLEKLLGGEIKKEKSHLLQIFRFMVNNSFFTEWPNKPLKFFQCSGKALNIDSQQAERQYLSYLNTLYGIDEGDAEVDGVNDIKDLMESCRNDHEADLDEVDGIKNPSVGRMECSRGDDFEADLDEKKVAEIERRDDLEDGEIEEGEIV